MANPLAMALASELRCGEGDAERLAALGRERIPRIVGSSEDSDEDIVLRLRDPRIFGGFVETLLDERGIEGSTKTALAEHAFDLLPLPRGEGDVFLVESRAPPRILNLASFLIRSNAFNVLSLMHLVYAVFLDRALITNVPRRLRAEVLRHVVATTESAEGLRVLYACMHLAAVPESEAHAELRKLLRDHGFPESVRGSIASVAASEDGGVAILTRLSEEEGLLPSDLEDVRSPAIIANIPRMPARLAALGRRWRKRDSL